MGTHRWVFHEAAGLYQLTGNNLDNPKLGRNGVGKSSLLDAILWCDYGKTSRGLRANEIITRGICSGPCSVVVEHVVRDQRLVIKRTQNPNSLTLNGEITDQIALTKALGRNYESFCYSGIIPQGKDMFFDLSPANKLSLFSEIMELDYWLELSNKALLEQKKLEIDLAEHQEQINLLLGSIHTTEQIIRDLKAKSSEWQSLQAEEINLWLSRKEGPSKEMEFRKADIARVEVCIPDLKKGVEAKAAALKVLEEKLKEADGSIKELDRELVVAHQNIKGCDRAIEQLKQIGAVCPVCAQDVDPDHMGKHISKLRGKLRRYLVDQEELLELLAFAGHEHSRLREKADHINNEMNEDLRQINKLEHHKKLCLNEIDHSEREIKNMDAQINKIKNQPNSFETMLRVKQSQLIADRGEYNKLEVSIGSLNEQVAAVTYWVMGFKRLRLLIIEETLQALELEVNNNLAHLGLAEWCIKFDIERENKSGGVTKGFNVMIYDPKYDYPIKWESFSAGETQLLKLAGSLGLANLICERAGLVNMIEFFDEASNHLSTEPINALCEVLNERAINSGRQIWVIDHSAIDYGGFAGTLTVVKDANGSRLE